MRYPVPSSEFFLAYFFFQDSRIFMADIFHLGTPFLNLWIKCGSMVFLSSALHCVVKAMLIVVYLIFFMLPWFSVETQNRFSYVTNLQNIIVAVPKFVPIPISEFDVHNTQGHDSRNNVHTYFRLSDIYISIILRCMYQNFKCMLKMIGICFTWK